MLDRKIVVLTDSTCDLPPEMAEKYNVDILNFEITVDGQSYVEREDFTFDEYYDILRTCEGIPHTSHITTPRFMAYFDGCAGQGVEQLLYVSICGAGSNTYNAAVMARENFYKDNPGCKMKIHLVDSHAYSMGYGWFVVQAAQKLQNGAEMGDVIDWLEDVFSRVEIYVGAFSLKYIKKSGRISAAAAFAGELLGLRPIISLIDGESKVVKKVRGDKEVVPAMIEIGAARIDDTHQFLMGGTDAAIYEPMAELLEKKWKTPPLATFKLGAAVTTNTGPDALGLVLLGPKRKR